MVIVALEHRSKRNVTFSRCQTIIIPSMSFSLSKKTQIAQIAASFVLWQLAFPRQVAAQTTTWSGVCISDKDPDVATLQGLQCLLANVLSVSLTFLGIAGFVMIVVASLRWLFMGGNTQDVEGAKKTMTFAVLGIVVALSAFIILNLVASFTGVSSILNFTIPDSNTQW